MSGRGYQDLVAWQKAMDLVETVYLATSEFPRDEKSGLTAQMGRAAISIPSNIAEGHGRASGRDFARFIQIALGSLAELETQLMIAERLNYLPPERLGNLVETANEVGRLLRGLAKSILSRAENET